jgi:uncharacterized protein YecE (DUF72 family)
MDALVGAGGWGYFSGGLEAYARGFRFVEVNVSFYRQIPEATARRWRSRVPDDFVFAVKANQAITHADRLRASTRARAAFSHDLRIARILRSPFLILETPPGLRFESVQVAGLRELAGMAVDGLRLGLEARAYRGQKKLPEALRRTMEQHRVLDVVDLSQGPPRVADEVVYTRLFGPGPANVYQFDDAELRAIDRASGDAVRAAFTFHGVRMYTDAARFLAFKRTGTFPPATSTRGPASLEEVLRPDARFLATREELEREHGWKVVDLDDRTRVHAVRLIENLPSRTYTSVADVLSEIEIPVPQAARSSPEKAYLGPK